MWLIKLWNFCQKWRTEILIVAFILLIEVMYLMYHLTKNA